MKTELKQKNSTTWVNVGDNLVIVCGTLADCEWYGSNRIVETVQLGDESWMLLLA